MIAPTTVGAATSASEERGLRRTTQTPSSNRTTQKNERAWMGPPRPFGGQQDRHCPFAKATPTKSRTSCIKRQLAGLRGAFPREAITPAVCNLSGPPERFALDGRDPIPFMLHLSKEATTASTCRNTARFPRMEDAAKEDQFRDDFEIMEAARASCHGARAPTNELPAR